MNSFPSDDKASVTSYSILNRTLLLRGFPWTLKLILEQARALLGYEKMTQRHTVHLASPETTSPGMAFVPPTYKVVLVGNLNVGKTTMLWRYLYHEFRTVEKRGTVVDVERKRIVVREREVEMEFWDTVGEREWHTTYALSYID